MNHSKEKLSSKSVSRRRFIQENLTAMLAASALPSIIPATAFGQSGGVAPNSRITVGCIGVGPQGRGDMGGFLGQKDAQVVAVCDVAKRNLEPACNQVNQHYQNDACKTYGDFRELLARPDIDAVLIATPDHWHVPVAIAAARAGKDMYLEKPMGLSFAEDLRLRQAVRDHKRVFQFGTQQRSGKDFRKACELVRNGRIGSLKQINVWCSASRPGGSTQPAPVPEGLNYDFWLGPAPRQPYTFDRCFDNAGPNAWKTWWFNYDYALGFIAGWGVHPLDIAYWGHPAMMKKPFELEGKAVIPTQGACNTAVAWQVDFTLGDGVGMKFKGVRNGHDQVSEMNDVGPWLQRYGQSSDHGTAFEGADGWVMVSRGALRTFPEKLAEERFGPNEIHLPQSSNHVRNFLDSVRSRAKTICPIDESVDADLLCHVSDIATRLPRKLKWDPAAERFLNDDEANRKLELRPVREPWNLS